MPIYEFVCRECGSEFEQLMSFSAHGHPPCPACASPHVSRKIGRPAIHFKGSGWYVTDSKASKSSANGDGKPSEEKGVDKSSDKIPEKAAEKPSDGKSGTSTEKPAAPATSAGSPATVASAD